ncbi:small subunit ribosomal protein S20 [Brevibacterium luteolum]|nr:small subunit ribosomal protein S20 [Brevibacterium luteolum]
MNSDEHERVLDLANIKSQIKRNLTNEKARQRNRIVRTEVKTAVRAVREQVEAGNAEEAQAAFQKASRKLDKAVSKGVLHRNNAANRKSKLAKKVNAL